MGYFLITLSSTFQYLFQVFLSRSLISNYNNISLSFSVIIGTFLLGHSFGLSKNIDFLKNNLNYLKKIQLLYFFCFIFFLFGFYFLKYWQLISNIKDFYIIFILHLSLSFIIGFFTGQELHLIIENYKLKYNQAIALSYLGPAFGLIFSNLLLFYLKNEIAVLMFILVFPLIFLYALNYLQLAKQIQSFKKKSSILFLSLFFLFQFILILELTSWLYKTEKSIFYLVRPPSLSFQKIIHVSKVSDYFGQISTYFTPFQTIDVIKSAQDYLVFIDRNFQFSISKEKKYHSEFVQAALNNQSKFSNILVIGGGDGLLVRNLLKINSIEKITLVELDQKMIQLAQTDPELILLNENSLANNKVNIIIDDGYSWILSHPFKFDLILMDLPIPKSADLSKLFSVEMFYLIFNRLESNGTLVFDFPKKSNNNYNVKNVSKVYQAVFNSLEAAGFQKLKIHGTYESFIVGSKLSINSNLDYCSSNECNSLFHPIYFSNQ